MSTAEDVWYLYERNNKYYNNEEKYILPIEPETIGNQSNKCNFKRKVYIRPDEECSICLDKINKKSTAYLTGCGHSFHKKCLFNLYEIKRNYNPFCVLKCPICRTNMGLEISELSFKYHINLNNNLDRLENFWIKKDYLCCDICPNRVKIHYIGMNKKCKTCIKYHNGDILFGL
jgi:hypothetical protein